MSEIEVGQERVDAKGFTWRVVSFGGTVRIERTDGRAGRTVSLSTVRKMALYPRSIRLPLAKDTTESHCGGCCGLLETDRGDICGRYGTRWLYRKHGELVRQRPTCGEKRTDSERYAELRTLVEAWQTARSASERDRASIPPAVSSVTANPTGQPEGWLARFMDTCAAETLLADWSHR